MNAITRTGVRYGAYYVYTDGTHSWYREEGGPPQSPTWYVWRNDNSLPDGFRLVHNPANYTPEGREKVGE